MNNTEFSNGFDLYFNNITNNQAPGLNEWEKSMFLTKAEKEVTLNHFTANSKGNNTGLGFDDSAKRQADFSVLMKTGKCEQPMMTVVNCYSQADPSIFEERYLENLILTDDENKQVSWDVIPYDVTFEVDLDQDEDKLYIFGTGEYEGIHYFISGLPDGFPYPSGTLMKIKRTYKSGEYPSIDPRSGVYSFPEDTFIIINESLYTADKKILQVVPLRYDEYTRLMSKPFKRPLKNQAWRLMNSGEMSGGNSMAKKYAEIVVNTWDENNIASYNVRYVRVPKPIILSPVDGLSIDGYYGRDNDDNLIYKKEDAANATNGIECELDPILHEEILQRAVELAKIAWTATGQDNLQAVMQAGQRSE